MACEALPTASKSSARARGIPEPVERSWSKYDTRITLALFGGTLGAAGWIFGAAGELMGAPAPPAGILVDILVVILCAVGVLLTGDITAVVVKLNTSG